VRGLKPLITLQFQQASIKSRGGFGFRNNSNITGSHIIRMIMIVKDMSITRSVCVCVCVYDPHQIQNCSPYLLLLPCSYQIRYCQCTGTPSNNRYIGLFLSLLTFTTVDFFTVTKGDRIGIVDTMK